MTPIEFYNAKNEYLNQFFEEVTPLELYRDIFPAGMLERAGHPEDKKANGILTVVYDDGTKRTGRNRLFFDDLAEIESVINLELNPGDMVVTSACTYCGKNRKEENAYQLLGFIIDLDGVTMDTMRDLFYEMRQDQLPQSTYVANSGNGLHVYYLFEKPVQMYPYMHQYLDRLKHKLTEIVWNAYTSEIPKEKKQFQGIFQGFRMPGTQSKLGREYPVVAFRTGKRYTLNELNAYLPVPLEYDFDRLPRFTLEDAKEIYPEWYERRIEKGEERGRWTTKRALYDWWIRQIKGGAFDGNRYNCVCTLFACAIKCRIDRETALQDALELIPFLESRTEKDDNHFTEKDVYDALRFCEENYVTYSKNAVMAKTKIVLPDNHRKYRKQSEHLKIARFIRDEVNGHKDSWINRAGRPKGSGTKEELVREYAAAHPGESVSKIARALNISRTTVYKYLQEPCKTQIEPESAKDELNTVLDEKRENEPLERVETPEQRRRRHRREWEERQRRRQTTK